MHRLFCVHLPFTHPNLLNKTHVSCRTRNMCSNCSGLPIVIQIIPSLNFTKTIYQYLYISSALYKICYVYISYNHITYIYICLCVIFKRLSSNIQKKSGHLSNPTPQTGTGSTEKKHPPPKKATENF